MHSLALFGGAFDPIHQGHLAVAKAIQAHFQFDEFRLVPAKESLLKPPMRATTEQRLHMVRLALKDCPGFNLDLQEIERPGPSYTVDTLAQVRKEQSKAAITLIMGFDGLLSLPQWHQWQKIIQLANLLILHRPGYEHETLPPLVADLVKTHQVKEDSALLRQKAGGLCFFDAGRFEVSSSLIREGLAAGKAVESLLAPGVYDYIIAQRLYRCGKT